MWETWVWSLGWEDLLEKGKTTHSSILAWRLYSPWGRTWLSDFHFHSHSIHDIIFILKYDSGSNVQDCIWDPQEGTWDKGSWEVCLWRECYSLVIMCCHCRHGQPKSMRWRCMCVCVCSVTLLFAATWSVAHHAPLSMGFFWQKYWSRVPFLIPGDLPDPGIKPMSLASPTLEGRFFTTSATWEALRWSYLTDYWKF